MGQEPCRQASMNWKFSSAKAFASSTMPPRATEGNHLLLDNRKLEPTPPRFACDEMSWAAPVGKNRLSPQTAVPSPSLYRWAYRDQPGGLCKTLRGCIVLGMSSQV